MYLNGEIAGPCPAGVWQNKKKVRPGLKRPWTPFFADILASRTVLSDVKRRGIDERWVERSNQEAPALQLTIYC